ncbi:transporter [Sedimenticola hydrogenitrophicus]|uniref:transporter n=1 Tax=Sedimenticola hydrogenitrophicus TaxID=2967975 RepID=UPI0023B1F6A7|nr:transporter [Sedimenticola hydrogenitrophicus]
MSRHYKGAGWAVALTALLINSPAWAHDPVFGIGPHVLYKGGVEVATEVHLGEAGEERELELGLELVYGITGDWAAGIELPYAWKEEGAEESGGPGDLSLFTKYRFWRHDTLGAQEGAAVLLKIKTDTGDEGAMPALGTDTTDAILGLTYGYESLKWYRWASLRYRHNGENDAGLLRGDKVLLDLAAGWRPRLPSYYLPDTVWLLELNGEYGRRAELNGTELPDSGGTEWFLSPGIFWTKRNFAVKAGVQIPIASDLNGNQEQTDYRAKLVLEWHL